MIEVLGRRLDARQRHRWQSALSQTPILADPAPRTARGPEFAALASAFVYVAMLVVILAEGAWGVGQGVMWALVASGVVLVVRTAAWMQRESRSSWNSGRYLYRWGYVEIEHDVLRYVPGDRIRTEIERRPFELGGPSAITVRLHDEEWSTAFYVAGDENELHEELAALGAGRPGWVGDGYREAPWFADGPRASAVHVPPRMRELAWIAAAAIGGALAAPALQDAAEALAQVAEAPAPSVQHGPGPTSRVPSRIPRR